MGFNYHLPFLPSRTLRGSTTLQERYNCEKGRGESQRQEAIPPLAATRDTRTSIHKYKKKRPAVLSHSHCLGALLVKLLVREVLLIVLLFPPFKRHPSHQIRRQLSLRSLGLLSYAFACRALVL